MQSALTELPRWKLDHDEEDIRGWSLCDTGGQVLGTVDELIVDTDSRHVTQVVLADGKRYAAHDVLIGENGENDLELADTSGKVTQAAEAQPALERQAAPRADVKTEVMRSERDLVVPVIEEEIRVGKRAVDAGGMHLESKLVSEPFEQEVRLREERVTVERRRVDHPLTLADADARLNDGVVELRATAEKPVLEKRARVVEEVLLKKDSAEHVEHVRDSVRHTEVKITELGKSMKGAKP